MTTKAMEKMAGGIKLNYAVPKVLDDALSNYCEQTGRTASDVIRQLLAEYIEGERTLSTSPKTFGIGIRSNMILPKTLKDLLDSKIAADGEASRGAVIVRLLYDFLEHKIGVELNETVTLSMGRELYNKLYEKAQKTGKSVEEIIMDACRDYK
jgi:metal-responsive CopG/Arc/MetJ family transcriptional regulator